MSLVARNTDKGEHGYLPYYERHLDPGRINMLVEIGVARGGSLCMWREWLPLRAHIVGIDIDPAAAEFTWSYYHPDDDEDGGYEIIIADASAYTSPFPTDVLIDDGSHHGAEQVAAFRLWWPQVTPGGVYVIEDLATVWHDGFPDGGQVVDLFRDVVRDVTDVSTALGIEALHVYEQIIFIEKRRDA